MSCGKQPFEIRDDNATKDTVQIVKDSCVLLRQMKLLRLTEEVNYL